LPAYAPASEAASALLDLPWEVLMVLNWGQKVSSRTQLKILFEEPQDLCPPRANSSVLYKQECKAVIWLFYVSQLEW
jgi:hypothetical protein